MPETVSHTPGPWHAARGDVNDPNIVDAWGDVQESQTTYGYSVATVWADADELTTRAEANAHLIAAAPELLAELTATLDWLSSFSMPPTSTIAEKQERIAAIEAVIAKAEGRA